MPVATVIRGYQPVCVRKHRRVPHQRLLIAALLICALPLAAAHAASAPPHLTTTRSARHARLPVLSAYDRAMQLYDQLEAVPAQQRTRTGYTTVLDAFRAVYHDNPRDTKAPDSIYRVAGLLAEQGRVLGDTHSLQAAIGQYEFLRKQYPTSSFRVRALLAEAQIEQNDLHDASTARVKYDELLEHYPHSAQADEARQGLAGLRGARQTTRAAEAAPQAAAPIAPSPQPETRTRVAATTPADNNGHASQSTVQLEPKDLSTRDLTTTVPVGVTSSGKPHPGALASVTSIRHWSTNSYTRVVIDLGSEVAYGAVRVSNPDRIYFDLHDARLAHDLMGKSFAITDDGYLRRIRAAQFSNDITRIVLDVGDVTDYSAFLLPNPYRLIIDIHGKSQNDPSASGLSVAASESSPLPSAVNSATGKSGRTINTADTPSSPRENTSAANPPKQTIGYTPSASNTAATTRDPSTRDLRNNRQAQQPVQLAAASDASLAVPANSATATTTQVVRDTRLKGSKIKGRRQTPDDTIIAHAAEPTSSGELSLVRTLGLKIGRIVVDAGHGGHDSGTLGPGGIEEKDVVLDVALKLGKLLQQRLGAEVIYTRSDDTFIPLETRTAIANQAKADLFISVHANSSSDPGVRGVETYYLNFTSQRESLDLAARENAVSNESVYQLSDLVKKIALKEKIDESREFAFDVEQALYGGLQNGNAGLKDRGVKKAPFVVLIGANMPSILAEISFVTNPKDARLLRNPAYTQRIAESLYRGVAKYANGLSGMHIAQLTPPAEAR